MKEKSTPPTSKSVRKVRRTASKPDGTHLAAIYQQAPIGIVECSPEGVHVNVNEEFCRITGYEREELLTHSIKDISYGDDYVHESKLYAQLLLGQIPSYKIEKRYVRKDSEIIWVEVIRSAVRDAKGKALYTVGIVQDITERRLAEAQIRFQAQLLENVHDAIIATDDMLRITSWNRAAEELYGWTAEEVLGRSILEVTQSELTPAQISSLFLQEKLSKENASNVEAIHYHRNGYALQVEVRSISLRVNESQVMGYVTSVRDVTRRKQAEKALLRSEERMRRAFEIETVGIIFFDTKGAVMEANDAFLRMSGYTREDTQKGHIRWDVMTPEEFMHDSQNAIDQLLTKGETTPYEKQYIRKDGTRWWGLFAAKLLSENEAVEFVLDITESKRAEAALRESEERLRAIINQATAGIVRADSQGKMMFANQAFCKMLGYTVLELIGKTIWEITFKDDVDENQRLFEQLILDGTPFLLEKRLIRKDGSIVWVNISVSRIVDAKGMPQSTVAIVVDISGRKQAEEALQELNLQLESHVQNRTAQLQAANRALMESHKRLQSLSQRLVEVQEEERRRIARELHDRVGQTLSALNINLLVMNNQLSDDAKQRFGPRLEDSIKLVAETIALVRNLMTELRPAELDDYGLEVALQAYINEYSSRFGIKVIFDHAAQPIPRLEASLQMTLLRIAQEALMNVARHAQASEVIVTLEHQENAIRLTIEDNGIGIQGLQDTKRPGSHGLKIMRERAEAFGGTVNIGTTSKDGTKIEALIPREASSQDQN